VGIRYSAFGFVSGPGGTRTLRSDRDRISDETSLLLESGVKWLAESAF